MFLNKKLKALFFQVKIVVKYKIINLKAFSHIKVYSKIKMPAKYICILVFL